MSPLQHESSVAEIDDGTRTELVRNALQDRRARLISWQEEAMGGGASGSELYKVWGEATSDGSVVPWTLIVKIFTPGGEQESSTEELAWDYWKREWLVYRAPWLHALRQGLVTPRFFGSGELDGPAAWVAMEDLSSADRRPWSPAQFVSAARHLGEFNGSSLQNPPDDPWLSRDWIRGWTERAAPMVARLSAVPDHPAVQELFTPSTINLLLRVWEHRHEGYQLLEALPQTICHQDLFPRNGFVRIADGIEQTVAIDWAFCGWAAFGTDLAPLIGASLNFFEVDWDEADELERVCLDAYVEGLRTAGWDGDHDDVITGYQTSMVLRFMVGAVSPILTFALDTSYDPVVEPIFGHRRHPLIAKWREVYAYNEARMASLLTTLGHG